MSDDSVLLLTADRASFAWCLPLFDNLVGARQQRR